jgi:hypothetical protein
MNSNFKYKLHIKETDITLLYDDVNTIGSRICEVREVRVLLSEDQFIMMFDERFNELDFIYNDKPNNPFNYVNQSTNYLKEKFENLKSKDFRYKTGSGYEGSKVLYLEDFINHLKMENRDKTIDKILENE